MLAANDRSRVACPRDRRARKPDQNLALPVPAPGRIANARPTDPADVIASFVGEPAALNRRRAASAAMRERD